MSRLSGLSTFFHSIRFRLVMWFTIILVLVLFTFSSFIYYNQTRDIKGDAMYHLERKFTDIVDVIWGSPKDSPVLQPNDVFLLFDSKGKVLINQGINSSQDMVTLINQAQSTQPQRSPDGDESTVWWIQDWQSGSTKYCFLLKNIKTLSGESGYAILGSPFDPYGLNNRLLFTLALGSILTIVIAISGGLWLADRAMRPVHAITQAARTIGDTDLNLRLNMKGKDELAELANMFDGMLARLQRAFERQRQFVADASHELRTPLTIVNLESSRALAGKRTPQEYQRALGVIHSENEFMSHLVGDLLTLARMDAGQLVMDHTRLDLSDVALEAVERLAHLAEKKHLHLEAGELPEVYILGDRQYLQQMLSNLIENGIKYTTGPEKHVRVETGLDGDEVWVRVSDNGEGIPAEFLPHLFTRFYRVDKARSREESDQQGGTGLGLSIVDWIVKAHEGEIRVFSEPGTGTSFEARFKSAE